MNKPKLLDQVGDVIRVKHYSLRTEKAYVHWIKAYIFFHHKRHPAQMGERKISEFLTHLAVDRNVAAFTQNQAFSALLFLYREVLQRPLQIQARGVWSVDRRGVLHWGMAKRSTLLLLVLVGAFLGSPTHGATAFVQRSGDQLTLGQGGPAITLRGVNLAYDRVSQGFCGAGQWRVADATDWGVPVTCWYQEKHFKLLNEIGFNVVRLNLSYRIFEDNARPGVWKASGWDLLDQLVRWGRRHNVYLILDMHVAPGGAGIVACQGCGYRTWDEPAYQQRLVALWQAIAARYAGESQIAAFDLLNEPAPTRNAGQWRALAQTLANAIRAVDNNHLLIVEMVNWIFDRNNRSPLQDFDTETLNAFQFLLDDPQVLYDFHDYIPKAYTLQYERGTDGGVYPDPNTRETTIEGVSMARDKAFLEAEMDTVIRFWKERVVPVNFGEWGTEGDPQRGGDRYARDMLDLMDERGLSWQFYYLNRLYRIDCCFADNPTTVSSPELVQLFTDYFHP